MLILRLQIKLTLSIEDPRIKAKRDVLGIEDERGASRDEVAGAFQTVSICINAVLMYL